MASEHEERVVGKRKAPVCMVLYRCPKCGVGDTFDAYAGPPSCSGIRYAEHQIAFMEPLRVIRDRSEP